MLACFANAMREIYYRNSREEWSTERHSMYIKSLLLVLSNFGFTHQELYEFLIDELILNPQKYSSIADA
jgi:hypothetical protein